MMITESKRLLLKDDQIIDQIVSDSYLLKDVKLVLNLSNDHLLKHYLSLYIPKFNFNVRSSYDLLIALYSNDFNLSKKEIIYLISILSYLKSIFLFYIIPFAKYKGITERNISVLEPELVEEYQYLHKIDFDLNENKSGLFEVACVIGYEGLIHWIMKDDFYIVNKSFCFKSLCEHHFFDIAIWLLSLDDWDLHENNEKVFDYLCKQGDLEAVKWLYYYAGSSNNVGINIHVNSNAIFLHACENGQVEVVEWLYNISSSTGSSGTHQINLREDDSFIFRCTCIAGQLEVAKLLYSYEPKVVLDIDKKVHAFKGTKDKLTYNSKVTTNVFELTQPAIYEWLQSLKSEK